MEILYIVLALLFGALFLAAEVLLLPGLSVGGIMALGCYGGAVWLGFRHFGTLGGLVTLAVVAILSLVELLVLLRARTWRRFALEQELPASGTPEPARTLRPGQRGRAVSRLSPMGTVEIDGVRHEAKSTEGYIDARTPVEVVGFENFSVLVKPVK